MQIEVRGEEPEVVSLSIPVGLIPEFRLVRKCHFPLSHITGCKALFRFSFRNFICFAIWVLLLFFLLLGLFVS